MQKNPVTLVYVPCPTLEIAQKLATIALTSHLAGCVNMWPIKSMYRNQGEIKTDEEIAMLIKTVSSNIDALVELLQQNHPYKIPCIVVSHGEGNNAYANWLQETCKY